jgi:hypothetical protein
VAPGTSNTFGYNTTLGTVEWWNGSAWMQPVTGTATWTTAGRPSSPTAGTFGYNSTLATVEWWNGTAWTQPGTGSSGSGVPSWATSGRPGSPTGGETGYNTTLKQLEYYNGTAWVELPRIATATSLGIKCDGTTNNSTPIQNAINAMTTAGGTLDFVDPGTCAFSSTLTLKNDVVIRLKPGVSLKWTGASGGTMFTTTSPGNTASFGVIGEAGSTIDPGGSSGAGTVFLLHSVGSGDFGGFFIAPGSATLKVFDLRADYGTASPNKGHNSSINSFHDIVADNIGTFMETDGTTAGTGNCLSSASCVVTLNWITNISAYSVNVCGFCFKNWTDNNLFRNIYIALVGLNSTGVVHNTGTPTVDSNGVYANNFHDLAIDTFGSGLNRAGVVLNATKELMIDNYFQAPTAELGSVINNYGESYKIIQNGVANSWAINQYEQYVYHLVGSAGADWSTPSFTIHTATSPGPNLYLNGNGTVWLNMFANFGTGFPGITWKNDQPLQLSISTAADYTGYVALANFRANGSDFEIQPQSNSIILGGGSALATTATTGFVKIPTMAGAPTGNCGGAAGKACLVVDTTNKKICYNITGTTWECSAAFTP